MANRAAFTINGAASSPPGFAATSAQALTLQLEVLPATDVSSVQFEINRKSVGAAALTFPSSGTAIAIAATPGSSVALNLPVVASTAAVSYEIVCRVVTAAGEFTFSRVVSVPNLLGLRKWVTGEQAEYSASGWYTDQNAMVDAVATIVAGSIVVDHGGLAGLGDDDHAQYELSAAPVSSLTGASNTLDLTHVRKWLRISHGSATTLTVPTNASVAFPIGTLIRGTQTGAGALSIAAAGGVTVNADALTVPGQFGWFWLKKVGTNEWDCHVGSPTIAGDASGTLGAVTVTKLRGKTLASGVGTPNLGEVLVYDGTNWTNGRTLTQNALAAAYTDGLKLSNTTAALVGTQVQASPELTLQGNWWHVGGAVSRTIDIGFTARRDSTDTPGVEIFGTVGIFTGRLAFFGYSEADAKPILSLGGTAAASQGSFRVPNLYSLFCRNNGNSADVRMLASLFSASKEIIVIGREATTPNHQARMRASEEVALDTPGTTTGGLRLTTTDAFFRAPGVLYFEPNAATQLMSIGISAGVAGVQFNGDLALVTFISSSAPTTGAAGGSIGILAPSGGTGNQVGGEAFIQAGAGTGSGAHGFATMLDAAGTATVRVGRTSGSTLGFFAATPALKQTVSGDSLLESARTLAAGLATYGLITDSGAWLGVSDPRHRYEVEEDFIVGTYTSTTSAVYVGPGGFVSGTGGTGGATAPLDLNSDTVVGGVLLTGGTAGGGASFANLMAGAGNYQNGAAATPSTANEILVEWRVYLPNLSDGTNTYRVYAGLSNGGTAGFPTYGAWVDYLSTSSANWRIGTNNGGSTTLTASSVAVTAAAWHRLTLRKPAGGNTWEAFVDGVSLGTQSTNAPTGQPVFPMAKIESIAGGVARTMRVDWCRYSVRWAGTARAA